MVPFSVTLFKALIPKYRTRTGVARADASPPVVDTISTVITVTLLNEVVALVYEACTLKYVSTELLNQLQGM